MFEQLDYIYHPSRDVAADVTYFVDRLGARLVFAIEGMGTRVAMVELTDGPPQILLAGHLEGDDPILVYRVPVIHVATRELKALGADLGHALESAGSRPLVRRPRRPARRDLRAGSPRRRGQFRRPARLLDMLAL